MPESHVWFFLLLVAFFASLRTIQTLLNWLVDKALKGATAHQYVSGPRSRK